MTFDQDDRIKHEIHDRAEEILEFYCGPPKNTKNPSNIRYLAAYRNDHNPDLDWDSTKRLWVDRVTKRGGDIMSLIARFEGWSTDTDFVKIIDRACAILGIEGRQKASPPVRIETPTVKPEEKKKTVFPTLDSAIAWMTKVIGKLEGKYKYLNLDGSVFCHVVKLRKPDGKKEVMQMHERTLGEYVFELPPGKKRPLFAAPAIRDAEELWFVEGEPCAEAMWKVGIKATTTHGGAGNSHETDWSTFPKRCKRVYMWPDNDPVDAELGYSQGKRHMEQIRAIIDKLDHVEIHPEIFTVDVDSMGLPPKGDVVDFFAMLDGAPKETKRSAVLDIGAEARLEPGPAAELQRHLADVISGKYKTEPLPWHDLDRLSKACMPGTVVILGGSPGASKSFALLQALQYWHGNHVPVCVFELEDDKNTHLKRALAQHSYQANLTDPEWIYNNPDEAKKLMGEGYGFIDSFGRRMWDAPDRQVSYKELAEWVKERCSEGNRIIAIDPVTAVAAASKPWVEDLNFIFEVKTAVRKAGATLFLVTHPRKAVSGVKKGAVSMDDLAGGSAFQRFTHTILWLQYMQNTEAKQVRASGLNEMQDVNRILSIMKCRNGKGAGANVGMFFDPLTLTFTEKGILV
jgi:hypothetical protein